MNNYYQPSSEQITRSNDIYVGITLNLNPVIGVIEIQYPKLGLLLAGISPLINFF